MTMRNSLFLALALLAHIVLTPTGYSSPFESLSDGPIRHTISGFVFPKRIGVFKREEMHQYNQAGSDVSAGYNAGVLIAATVYVYPAPNEVSADVLAREYASKRAQVVHGHQGVAVLSESPATLNQGGKKYVGREAFFSYRDIFARTPQNVKSQLLVFRDGPVFVEYRFTYPRDHSEEAEKEIGNFARDWSWR